MSDDKPLTSEEMIRRAREDLESPLRPLPEFEPGAHPPEPEDQPKGTTHNTPARIRASGSRPRRDRRQEVPPDPFFGSKPTQSQKARARAVSLVIGVMVALLGIAIALSAIASSTQ